MKINRIVSGLLLTVALAVVSCGTERSDGGKLAKETEAVGLRCRNLIDPEGVDKASLSWRIASDARNVVQTAWQIEIASSKKSLEKGRADVWNSEKQLSDRQLNIVPEGVVFEPGKLYWWRVRVWNAADEVTPWSEPARFSVGPDTAYRWQAEWITSEWGENSPMPYLRKEFDASNSGTKPERAVVYMSGLGCGDLYLNGRLVDETRVLDPAQTNYEQYAFYSTFDVTDLLEKGDNCIGVMLGDGWYNQDKVWSAGMSYGKPMLLLQMEITYKDGSKRIVATDSTWTWAPGPVLSANLYAGESYDANREIAGWASPGTPSGDWKSVRPAEGVIPARLVPQVMEPIRLKQEIAPVAMWQDSAGNWIFDFGVNVAAVPRLTVEQPQGTRLRMRMGERLDDNRRAIDYRTTGVGATGVVQTDEYVCKGTGRETWTPRFTYHGFRYLELSGAATQPDTSWLRAVVVHTDVSRRGSFECSDQQINRLHEMAVRTMLSNTHGLPTDCPHRERCGWLGDAHAVFPFESFNYDMGNFWAKYMADISSTSSVFLENTLHQKLYNTQFYFADKQPGIPFMISPGRRLCGVASPDWGTAVVQLPWYMYLYYDDEDALRKYYGEMKQWVDHVEALTENHIVPYGLGDWCPPGKIDCPIPLSSTAFHYLDASIVAKAAAVLGNAEDSARYADLRDRIGRAFVAEFYDGKNKTFGSQTADAMALDLGLVPAGDEHAVSDAIVRNIDEKYDGFIHTGIFGLGRIGQALSRYGNPEAAWRVFTKKGENSFEWMWIAGDATTLWEVLPIDSAHSDMVYGSMSHPMQGGYDAWFYEDIAGIRPDASGPGFKVIRFEPTMTGQLRWAEATLDTPYGLVESGWRNEDGLLRWKIVIPANASGLVALPEGKNITVDGRAFDPTDYPVARQGLGSPLYRFPSGSYTFEIR